MNGSYVMASSWIFKLLLFNIVVARSSIAKDVDKSIYGSTVPVLEGEKLSMRILVNFFYK